MNRAQNEVAAISHEQHLFDKLKEAQLRQIRLEHSGLFKWVKIKGNLKLLCRIDDKGELLPSERARIVKVMHKLGIK